MIRIGRPLRQALHFGITSIGMALWVVAMSIMGVCCWLCLGVGGSRRLGLSLTSATQRPLWSVGWRLARCKLTRRLLHGVSVPQPAVLQVELPTNGVYLHKLVFEVVIPRRRGVIAGQSKLLDSAIDKAIGRVYLPLSNGLEAFGLLLLNRRSPLPILPNRHRNRRLRQRPAAFSDLLRILKRSGYAFGWLGGNG